MLNVFYFAVILIVKTAIQKIDINESECREYKINL